MYLKGVTDEILGADPQPLGDFAAKIAILNATLITFRSFLKSYE